MSSRKASAAKTAALANDAERLGSFLYQMLLIRRFENKAAEMYTKGKVRGFLHLYNGEEACGVGALNALSERDKIVTHYRDHGHAIARGLEPKRIMSELFGRVDGTNGGRGGSMHLFDIEKGFLGGYAIVAGHMPIAVGLGLASNLDKDDYVTLCIFGDGGVGEGEFHEALNLASIWKAPVVFFCENNGYGMGMPFADSLPDAVHKMAAAYKMPSVLVDGMDVMAVHEATTKGVAHCRAGNGPYFIEAETYRYRGHSMADPELYREKSEVAERRKDDPIDHLKNHMMKTGMLDGSGYEDLVARAEQTVLEAVAFAEASPEPALDSLYEFVTKEPADG